jgi:DNA-binding transcriptional LysR family regulator
MRFAPSEHRSFTKAAIELCVTQGAVSHQVKALEQRLGLALFRGGGGRCAVDQRPIPPGP